MKHVLRFTFFVICLLVIGNGSQKVNCPNVVLYFNGAKGIQGLITIPPPKIGEWTTLNVSIGSNGPVFNNNRHLQLLKSKYESAQDAQNGINIRYVLHLPISDEIPAIKYISLNGKIICQGDNKFYHNNWSFIHRFLFGNSSVRTEHYVNKEEIYPSFSDWLYAQQNSPSTTTTTTERPVVTIRPRIADNGTWLQRLPFSCGLGRPASIRLKRQLVATNLILNGTEVIRGEFPWLVYLEYKIPDSICGGTLVSDRHVITAAHCVQGRSVIGVWLGKHDRFVNEQASVRRIPRAIISHHEFENGRPHADISIIMIDPVPVTPQIRPICIWPFGLQLDSYFRKGTVAGWGMFINDEPSSRLPMKTDVPVVSQEMCKQSNQVIDDLVTDHTLCAGGDLSGPCYGDSGSGLYYQHTTTWYLRGVVSTSLRDRNTNNCQTNHYAIYVDIAFYLDWLRPYLMAVENDIIEIASRINPRFGTHPTVHIV